jgi:recombination protein RecA
MPSIAIIRSQVEARIPGALSVYQRSELEVFPTGIPALDTQIGGIPKSALTQICAAPAISSGKTTLLTSLIAQVTQAEQYCAVVDASDSFSPASAAAMNVCLPRLLWVRCSSSSRLKPVEQAFKAADILVQNGGFGVIAIDLGNIEEAQIRKIPLTTWFRFARVVEKTPTALVVLMAYPAAQSCAALTLHIDQSKPHWSGSESLSHAQILSDVQFDLEIGRTRTRKPVQNANARFTAKPRWA